jgi:hypothetical protein
MVQNVKVSVGIGARSKVVSKSGKISSDEVGLDLKPTKGPAQDLVVDHIERPTED